MNNNYLFPKITITPKRDKKDSLFFKYQFSYSHNQLNKEIIKNNLEKAYLSANKEEIENGTNWYKKANLELIFLCGKYLINLDKICTITSVLSPLTYWGRNVEYTEKAINQFLFFFFFKVHIFRKNDNKVEQILNCSDDDFIIEDYMNKNTGRKTYNFTYNLYQPENINYVTIDSFMVSLACGLAEYSFSIKINNKGYDIIKEQVMILANKYKIIPCELQAILWNVSHRVNNKSYQDLISLVKEQNSEMVIEKEI